MVFAKNIFPAELDHRWARFTEMSLCTTWDIIAKKFGKLPSNFQVIDGSVRVDGSLFKNPHTFLERVDEHGDRWILCHTASQFMLNDGETVRKEDRIKELQRRAKGNWRTDLFTQVGNYALVYGRAKDIMQVLGLEYLPYI